MEANYTSYNVSYKIIIVANYTVQIGNIANADPASGDHGKGSGNLVVGDWTREWGGWGMGGGE